MHQFKVLPALLRKTYLGVSKDALCVHGLDMSTKAVFHHNIKNMWDIGILC